MSDENVMDMELLGKIHELDKKDIDKEGRLKSIEGQVVKQWKILETMQKVKWQVGIIVTAIGFVFGGIQTIVIAVLIENYIKHVPKG